MFLDQPLEALLIEVERGRIRLRLDVGRVGRIDQQRNLADDLAFFQQDAALDFAVSVGNLDLDLALGNEVDAAADLARLDDHVALVESLDLHFFGDIANDADVEVLQDLDAGQN